MWITKGAVLIRWWYLFESPRFLEKMYGIWYSGTVQYTIYIVVQNDKYRRLHGIIKSVTVCLLLGACYFIKMIPLHAFFHFAETYV